MADSSGRGSLFEIEGSEIAQLAHILVVLGCHEFAGRQDRECEICGQPDRAPHHRALVFLREITDEQDGIRLSPEALSALGRIARARDCNLAAALEEVVHEMQIGGVSA